MSTLAIYDRLRAIGLEITLAGRVPTIGLFTTPEMIQGFDLPTISFTPRGATLTLSAAPIAFRTRTWDITVFCAQVGSTLTTEAQDTAFEAMDKIPVLFGQRPQLQLNGVGLDGVMSVSLTADRGLQGPVNYPSTSNPQLAFYVVGFSLSVQTVATEGC